MLLLYVCITLAALLYVYLLAVFIELEARYASSSGVKACVTVHANSNNSRACSLQQAHSLCPVDDGHDDSLCFQAINHWH
jgi:hypothetical protein